MKKTVFALFGISFVFLVSFCGNPEAEFQKEKRISDSMAAIENPKIIENSNKTLQASADSVKLADSLLKTQANTK